LEVGVSNQPYVGEPAPEVREIIGGDFAIDDFVIAITFPAVFRSAASVVSVGSPVSAARPIL
jgi:hypothetical protein